MAGQAQKYTKSRAMDNEVSEPNDLDSLLSGAGNAQLFNPIMFLCKQVLKTNTLLQSVVPELKNVSKKKGDSS